MDKIKKDYRVLENECECIKKNSESEKEFYEKEMENTKRKCEEKIKFI